ncbi:hypothetical protein ACFQ07_14345, partial [Actinomadura adrarensis]
MSTASGQRGPVTGLYVLITFGPADGRPLSLRVQAVEWLHELVDTLECIIPRSEVVRRLPGGDGLLCFSPPEVRTDMVIELLPRLLAGWLARHNRR